MKFESGVRATIRDFQSRNENYIDSSDIYIPIASQTNNYNYTDEVYAAYMTFSQQLKKFSYQMGLRAESSRYVGDLIQTNQQFQNIYPISLFPSGSATYNLDDKDDLQLSYSRRINRPGFMQMIPYTDYSDSLNLSRGNPALKPEFTNSLEMSYLKNFNRSNNLLVTLWYKQTNNLITRFQVEEYDSVLQRNAIINTYENANSAEAYGLEVTAKNAVTKWFDLTANVNVYKSSINGSNLESDLTNSQYSYYAKISTTFHLPKDFSFQLFGDYQSKTSLPANRGSSGGYGGMGGGGGMMYGGNSTSTLQGFIQPTYGLDAALKYEFLKNKAASLTLNASDILKTRKNEVYSSTPYFTQTVTRTRDPQFFRLNFTYRFGKMDVSLFKRKNMKVNTEGMEGVGM
jgi:outer membrane receptor protein involved in Fe transport